MTGFDAFVLERAQISDGALARAKDLSAAKQTGLARALVETGQMSDADFAAHAGAFLEQDPVTVADLPQAPVLEAHLTPRFLTRAKCLPLADDGQALTLAMVDPFDEVAAKSVTMATARTLIRRVIPERLWEAALAQVYGLGDAAMTQLGDAFGPGRDAKATGADDMASDAPVIQMVKLIVSRAVRLRASDIHIEPFADRLQLRFRIDGILVDQQPPPFIMVDALTSRLKIMADLNIAERRRPQDGRFSYTFEGRDIDLRLSTVPTVHGESIVLRILHKSSAVFDFATLGMNQSQIDLLLAAIEQPNGMILTTGPTGSGKTTTLYAALTRLNQPERKIISIEDPVEYQLDGINQIAVNPRIDMGFASVLRNVLRQDPDVIMIGEMRDSETAEIAIRSAMTGHLVLSSAHTNTAIGAIVRLRDMGVAPYLISATLSAVLAQRLVRRLCPDCAEPRPIREVEARIFADPPERLMHPVGCDACAGTGYSGRQGLYEILPMTPELLHLVGQGAPERDLIAAAAEQGHRDLIEAGIAQAARGTTTLEEVLRVVGKGHG